MKTIENLQELESELKSLSKAYSGTMAAITLDDERAAITRVIKFLEEKEEWYKRLYYKNLLKENKNLLSSKELEKLNNNWLNSEDMIKLCDKYNIDYNIIDFKQ
jgi:hypothetical protein